MMLTRFLKLIGVGDDLLVHLDRAVLAFQRPGLLWLGLALLVPIGIWVVRRQRANLATASPGLRAALNLTRLAILLLLILVLAGPMLRLDYDIEKRPVVALLFDRSQSMSLPAGPFSKGGEAEAMSRAIDPGNSGAAPAAALKSLSRAGLVEAVLNASGPRFLHRLAERFEVRSYAFGRAAVRLAPEQQGLRLAELPASDSGATHLGDAIARALDDAAGRPMAGVFLFSDGQNTGGRSPAEAVQAASRAGTPVISVPAGSSTRPRDVAIVDVFTSGQVSKGDTARVSVTVESHGFDSRPVKIELREGDKLLNSTSLTLHDAEQQQVDLTFPATEPGAKYLTVAVLPLQEEPEHLRANNTEIAFVRVSDEPIRVLLLDGSPRWDFRFLKNAIRRDNGLGGKINKDEPDVVLETELRRLEASAQSIPHTAKDLAEYHTVILGDASPRLIDASFVTGLVEAVREHGLGLIIAAGPQFTPQRLDERLREILPVRLRGDAAGIDAPAFRPFALELSVDGSVHEVMRLYDDPGRNQIAWSQMPPYYWCAAVERPAPAACVLAWNPAVVGRFGKLPLIVHHNAGRGRVLFVGTDSTWLWRRNVGDRFFYKFWGQALRFVARRDEEARSRSRIEVRPVRARPGEEAQIELDAVDPGGQPRIEPSLAVQLTGAGQSTPKTIELAADPATRGRYTGKFLVTEPGEYALKYEQGARGSAAEARFRVVPASEELRHTAVNRQALESLAAATEGKLVELPDLASIPSTLKGEATSSRVHAEDSLWDNGVFLLLLVFLYSLDVALRRLAGLS
jgi:hypothetical protein